MEKLIRVGFKKEHWVTMTEVWYIGHHIELLRRLLHIYLLDWNNLETCSSDRLQYGSDTDTCGLRVRNFP